MSEKKTDFWNWRVPLANGAAIALVVLAFGVCSVLFELAKGVGQ